MIVISKLIPTSPARTLNVVEFHYTEEVELFEPEYVEAQQTAYEWVRRRLEPHI